MYNILVNIRFYFLKAHIRAFSILATIYSPKPGCLVDWHYMHFLRSGRNIGIRGTLLAPDRMAELLWKVSYAASDVHPLTHVYLTSKQSKWGCRWPGPLGAICGTAPKGIDILQL